MRRWIAPAVRPRWHVPVVAGAASAMAGPVASNNQAQQAPSAGAEGRRDRSALRVNNDAGLEAEADRAADAVLAGERITPLHRAAAGAQRKCSNCEDASVQAKAEGGPPEPALARPNLGRGKPLGTELRREFEPRFGADFTNVRLHDDGVAAAAGRQLRARAFTLGEDIVFAPGQLQPDSDRGRRLLAHELAHVVQQSGAAPQWQADGGLSESDMAALRDFIAAQEPAGAPQPARRDSLLPMPGDAPLPFRSWSPRADDDMGTAIVCPSCHQTPAEQRATARRREAERWQREREAAWGGMVEGQSRADLGSQAGTLSAEVENTRTSIDQLRLQMFDFVVASRASAAAPNLLPDASLRDAWLGAAQAAVVLEAALAATTEAFPPELAAPLREPFTGFLDAAAGLFDALDVEGARLEARFGSLGAATPAVCPGACHAPPRPTPPRLPPMDSGGAGTLLPLPGMSLPRAVPEFVPPAPGTGHLGRQRVEARARVIAAVDPAGWRVVLRDFGWAQGELDRRLRERLREQPQGAENVEQMQYTEQLLARQQDFAQRYPDAVKIQAVFYPKHEFAMRPGADRPGEESRPREGAKAIPWQFYLTRTPILDNRHVPTGYTWELHDITAPNNAGRTVRQRHVVSMFEALARERGPWSHPEPIDQVDPPTSMFEEMNHKDFFPEGVLKLHSPITDRYYSVTMTASMTLGDWLTGIGMTLAILGSFIFAPMSVPMVAAVLGGTALSAAGRIHRYLEREEHGVAEPGEMRGLIWDLSVDIVSALTLGLGKVAQVGLAAGTMARSSSVVRLWFRLRQAQVGLGVVNIGVLTHDFVQQYTAIQDSRMTPEQKRAALTRLTLFAIGSGVMSFASLRADIQDARSIRLDPDPAHPGRLLASADEAVDAAAQGTRRGAKLGAATAQADDGEHHFTLWADGSMTRCSPGPCPHPSDLAHQRITEMRNRMQPGDARHDILDDIAADARRLREEANRVVAGPAKEFELGKERVLRMAQELEARLNAIERRVRGPARAAPRAIDQPDAPTGTVVGRVTRAERDAATGAPLDWQVQRVQPDDLPDVVPHGVVLEYPTGERVWRSPGGGIVIESTLGASRVRQHFEREHFRRGEMGRADYVDSDLELAHSQGAGTGHESRYAIVYAPREVNQELQNLGIEEFLRTAVRNPTPGVTLQQVTHTQVHPRTNALSQIDYAVYALHQGERRLVLSVSIRVERVSGGGRRASIIPDQTFINPTMERVLPLGDLAYTMRARREEMMERIRSRGR